MNIQDAAERYKQKLIESNFRDVNYRIENETIVLSYVGDDEKNLVASSLKLKRFESKWLYFIGSVGHVFETIVYFDPSNEMPITDLDRLNNKLFKNHRSSPYDHHANRFVETAKHFYNLDLTLEEYDELCNVSKQGGATVRLVYRLNGSTFVGLLKIKGKEIYVIHGTSYQGVPAYKTCLPDIYHINTLLPVPDKLLIEGIDRVSFSKQVRLMVIQKRLYYEKLSKDLENKSNKELFLSTDLSHVDKVFVSKLRKTNPQTYQINDAVEQLIKEASRSRIVPGSTSSES